MTVAAALVDASQPWPGPIPFDESAQAFFYGRDTAVDELLRLIARDVGVTLFGRSGLGKTSLLQAGVFPKLREATFLPVPIRLSYSQDDGIGAAPAAQGNDLRNQIGELVPDLVVQVAQRLFQTMEDARIVFPQLSQHDDLWSYLHRADFVDAALSQGAIPVFVFDQFEELFTRGMADPARQQDCVDLLDLLADLIQGRVPNALRHRFEHFPDAMARLRLDQPAYRIVIALREDYLPFLEELSARAPMFNRSRFRLLPMNRAEALLAVEQPGKAVLDSDVAQLIVSVLAGDDPNAGTPGEIDPSILSLFCHELNVKRLALNKLKIDRSFVSDERDQILASFYERCFEGIPERVRDLVESELITDGGVRVEISLENAIKNSGGDRRPFDALASRRLVRFENRRGSTRLELVHDVLIDPMRKSAELRARSRAIAEGEAARKDEARRRVVRLRRALFLSLGGLAVAGTLALLLAISMSSQEKARAQSQLVSCVMPMFVAGDQTGSTTVKDGLRGRDALLAVTSKMQKEVGCGASLPLLMQRTGSQRRDTILWAIGLSTMPGSSKDARTNVDRIETALNLARSGTDERNDDARDADARLAQAELWQEAGKLEAAASAIAKAASLYRDSQIHRDIAGQLRLSDLLNREGEIRTELKQWRRVEPLLRQALAIRKRAVAQQESAGKPITQQGRFLLAQSYAALGRVALRENAAAQPKAFEAIKEKEAPSASLTKSGYHAYDLCLSRDDKDGAGRGLKRDGDAWKALASFCLNHRIKTLLTINMALTKSSVSKLLSMANVDLNAIPESEKQKYFDVLQFMSGYYRRNFIANPSDDDAKRLTGTYSRWLVKVKRDVFSQGPTPDRLRSLVGSLNDLSHYYQMTGRLDLATATSARACLLASEDPEVYSVWGTALALANKAADAQTLYGRASRLFKTSASTQKSIQNQLFDLRRARTPSVDHVVAAMNRLNEPIGERALGRCDDGFLGEL